MNGPWTFATNSLPADFSNIPADSPRAAVLSSVPGHAAGQPGGGHGADAAQGRRRHRHHDGERAVRRAAPVRADPGHADAVRHQHVVRGDPGQRQLLRLQPGGLVRVAVAQRSLGSRHHGAAGHLHHSADVTDVQRDVRADLRCHADDRRHRLHRRLQRRLRCRRRRHAGRRHRARGSYQSRTTRRVRLSRLLPSAVSRTAATAITRRTTPTLARTRMA